MPLALPYVQDFQGALTYGEVLAAEEADAAAEEGLCSSWKEVQEE